jgi:hypothetical protein
MKEEEWEASSKSEGRRCGNINTKSSWIGIVIRRSNNFSFA